MQSAKTKIGLRIRAAWSESSLIICAYYSFLPPGYPKRYEQTHVKKKKKKKKKKDGWYFLVSFLDMSKIEIYEQKANISV